MVMQMWHQLMMAVIIVAVAVGQVAAAVELLIEDRMVSIGLAMRAFFDKQVR